MVEFTIVHISEGFSTVLYRQVPEFMMYKRLR